MEDKRTPYGPEGIITGLRFVLGAAIDLMSREQNTQLLEMVTANLTSLEELWSGSMSVNQANIIKTLYSFQFRLRERGKLMESEKPPLQDFYMVCIKCNFPLRYFDLASVCPVCNSNEWLEPTHVP